MAKTRDSEEFQNEIDYLFKRFYEAEDEAALAGFDDPFVTIEQKNRDIQITALLTAYVNDYAEKSSDSKKCRYAILIPCLLIVIAFAICLVVIVFKAVNVDTAVCTEQLIGFITACISFISLIIGLLTIITKYFFPEDDEKYITQIVDKIQQNDLENKRENAKNTKKL